MAEKKKATGSKKVAAKAKPAARKPAPKKATAKAAPKKSVKPESSPEVDSELAPRAERGGAAIVCSQCDSTIDGGTLRIVLAAGEALHPGCTFGWTLDHFANTTATADWMATMMQRSHLSPEDRAELLEELGAPRA
jgi:hypothetical protein